MFIYNKSNACMFLIGSYGMLAPVQGGIGAYHFMVIAALTVYGIGSTDANVCAYSSRC